MKINFFNLIIEILTVLSIIFALAVITSTNPVIAIGFLIALFLMVAFYLILMGITFIGLSYLLIYIGAITVLVLFIVMMISTDILQTVEIGTDYSKLLPLSYSIAVLFLALFLITIPSFVINFSSLEIYNLINNFILYLLGNNNIWLISIIKYDGLEITNNLELLNNSRVDDIFLSNSVEPATLFHKNLQIQTIGQSIYGKYSILLLLSAFLLLLALVAPILLTRTAKVN